MPFHPDAPEDKIDPSAQGKPSSNPLANEAARSSQQDWNNALAFNTPALGSRTLDAFTPSNPPVSDRPAINRTTDLYIADLAPTTRVLTDQQRTPAIGESPTDSLARTVNDSATGVRKTASGATVHTGADGLVEEIQRSNGEVIKVNYKTERDEKGNRVVASYTGLPDSASDIKVHANGNVSYVSSENKTGEMTIVRGDGTVLKGLSDKPEFHDKPAEFAEYRFDDQGRITHVIPTSEAFWREGARSREFIYKGDTNELATVAVITAQSRFRDRNGQEYFTVFSHERQANSQWTCHDNFGRQLRFPQGEHSLTNNGVYTTPDVRREGRSATVGTLTVQPDGTEQFEEKDADKEPEQPAKKPSSEENKDKHKPTKHGIVDVKNSSDFNEEVLNAEGPVLVDFWAPWCGPCRSIAPAVSNLANEYDGRVKVVKVNIDHNQALASKYNIRSIPSLYVFNGGKVVAKASSVPEAKSDINRELSK